MSIMTFNTRSRLVTAAIFGAMFFCYATPASATEIRQAVRLCDKNPNCDYRIGGADGGMDFTINGVTVVSCPASGQCTCVSKPCGAARTSGPVKNSTLGVLSAPRGTATTGQKPGIGKPLASDGGKPAIAGAPVAGKPGISKPIVSGSPKPMAARAPKVEGFAVSKPIQSQPVTKNIGATTTGKGGRSR